MVEVVLMNRWLSGVVGFAMAGLASAASAQAPRMTVAQARLLYAAGGFPISADGKSPTNRCGKAASPTTTLVDMNADGRKEVLFIDTGACYQPDGCWYAVATQDADGSWRRILEGAGTVQAVGTLANSWFVLNTTSAGKVTRLYYNGTVYADARAATAVAAKPSPNVAVAKPATGASAPAAPAPAARDAAIFRAAGFKRMRGHWESGCNDPSTGAVYEPGKIEQMKDLNGDGRPEAVVIEGGSYCYGNTGQAFWLVSQQANGSWKLMMSTTGIAEFLPTKGVGGWPDISIGGPGFCFPVVRWNGSDYVQNRMEYEGKVCRPNR
jgi:hypothetical protein